MIIKMVKKITIKEIAQEAGVSRTAVSFHLNGKAGQYNLSDNTCERIEKIIKKHNYVPNFHAKAINSGKTYLIGLVLENINRSFWTEIIAGIEEAIEEYQYHMLLAVSYFRVEREKEILNFLNVKGVDGFIFAPMLSDDGIPLNLPSLRKISESKPLVAITYPVKGFPSVYNDNSEGGRIAAEHLYGNGHRKVAFIGHNKTYDTRARAFVDYFAKKKIRVPVFDSTEKFMPEIRKYTAVFCYTDYMLLDLYGKSEDAGIGIPKDISVIGYDNMDFVKYLKPSPATIHQHKTELGHAAGELLMKMLHNNKVDEKQIRFIPELIAGKSVGAASK